MQAHTLQRPPHIVGPHFQRGGPHFHRGGPHFDKAGPHFQRVGPHFQMGGPYFKRVGPHFERGAKRRDRREISCCIINFHGAAKICPTKRTNCSCNLFRRKGYKIY